jgi:hypothetical protein
VVHVLVAVRADLTLVSDRNNNEQLFINLATVMGRRISIIPPAQSCGRWQKFKLTIKMRKILITFLTVSLFWNTGISQDLNIELNIQNKKIEYFKNLEEKLGSKIFNTGETVISDKPVAQPEVYIRKEEYLPDLLVYYTFFKADSTISEIEYEWDVYNFDKSDHNIKSLDFEKKLIERYKEIVAFISSKYGKSKEDGNLDDLSNINTENGLRRNDVWQPNDSLKIYSYTTISDYYKKGNSFTISPTHVIRLYVDNLKGENKGAVNFLPKLNVYEQQFNLLLTLLSDNKFGDAKKLFPKKIEKSLTDDILNKLKSILVTNDKFELFMSGMQMAQDGKMYPMLQFKESSDTNTPPKKLIIVLFDNESKIIGLKPVERE